MECAKRGGGGWWGRMKRHDNSRREETANEMKTVKTRGGSRRFMEHVEDKSTLTKER